MSSPSDFVHLHVHSDASLIDGAAKTAALAKAAARAGHLACAITDHGTVSGNLEFWKACDKNGVKPIMGCEAYLAPGLDDDAHTKKEQRKDVDETASDGSKRKKKNFDAYSHFTLLAKNKKGWENLQRLSSIASIDGFYYRPRMSWSLLKQHHEGLIALSGCLSGEIGDEVRRGDLVKAEAHARRWKDLFGDDFYVELMPADDTTSDDQSKVNDACLAIARKLGSKIVATSDVHYIDSADAEIQEIKICVNAHKTIKENRINGLNMEPRYYYKTTDEITKSFSFYPEAIKTTREIADKCEKIKVFAGKGEYYMPHFVPPDGSEPVAYFRRLCREGLVRRYGVPTWSHWQRLEYEMECIQKMGFVHYFLVVGDFMMWAKKQGVPCGPGRGSAAGAIVAYCLGITNIDPLRYGLLFERFLNPARVSMPDIDLDFCDRRRHQVINYVKQKYGEECVGQIATFGMNKAKSAVKDVGRVIEAPLPLVNKISSMIPGGPKADLKLTLETSLDMQREYTTNPQSKEVIDKALRLLGFYRSIGRHAAGVVISDKPLIDRIALLKLRKNTHDDAEAEGAIITAFPMEQVEAVGLLKMDFLGLSTLTQIHDTLDLIRRSVGTAIDPDTIPVRDLHSMKETAGDHPCPIHRVAFKVCRCCDKTLELYQSAEMNGVFQVESGGMKKLLIDMAPDRFDDIVALVALYRPGPLGSGMHETYVKRKNGEEPVEYEHPALESITLNTYGVWCYQEQLMQLSVALAGFSMSEADELRKVTAKKKPEDLPKVKDKFIPGCLKHSGLSIEKINAIWDKIVFFSEYSFNLAHSAAYAMVSWHTAWLKANFPVEFMAALMTRDAGVTDNLCRYIDEARSWGIQVDVPNVNESDVHFTVKVSDRGVKSIVYGLQAIKGIGHEAAIALVQARRTVGSFKSLDHFCASVPLDVVNSKVIEQLAKAGAFDALGYHRSWLVTTYEMMRGKKSVVEETPIDAAIRGAKRESAFKAKGQRSLFAAEEEALLMQVVQPKEEDIPRWTLRKRFDVEREAIGFYLSGHPLDEYMDEIRRYTREAIDMGSNQPEVRMGGIISGVRTHIDKKNNEMAFVSFMSITSNMDVVCFAKVWERIKNDARHGVVGFFVGSIDTDRSPPQITAKDFITLERARAGVIDEQPRAVVIEIWDDVDGSHDAFVAARKYLDEVNVEGGLTVVVAHRDRNHPETPVTRVRLRCKAPANDRSVLDGIRSRIGDAGVVRVAR